MTAIASEPRVRLRPATSAKFRMISLRNRWTLTETADAIADFYLEQHGLGVPSLAVPLEHTTHKPNGQDATKKR